MTSLTYQADRDCINSLGIPVDKLTLASAVDRIIDMARKTDGRARLVSTLNVDFLVNSLGTALSRPRHPELLKVLRSSDLVTADGFPIVWLSRILGRPLPGRVCGSDLTPALADRCAREGLSIFLLGGGEGSAAAAGRLLEERYPGLRIAGTAAPFVHTAGEGLASMGEDDERLLDEIHRSGAHILLVGLGNPKQELWFNRNRSALKVPVSIGVGGTFEFITGKVRRAPRLMQRLNLEWLYRITQDPARLWKRYGKGLVKLALLAAPVVASRIREGLPGFADTTTGVTAELNWRQLWSSRDQSISLLTLPKYPDSRYLAAMNRSVHGSTTPGALQILDFSGVRRISLNSQQELFNLASLLQSRRGQLQLMGLSPRVRKQLAAARLMDLLDGTVDGALGCVTRRPKGDGTFSCQSYSLANTTLVTLAGRVDRESLASMGFVECLMHSARDRTCVIDMRNVDLLESSGIAELMPLLTRDDDASGSICLSGVSHGTAQMLRMAEVAVTAGILDDTALLALISGESDRA